MIKGRAEDEKRVKGRKKETNRKKELLCNQNLVIMKIIPKLKPKRKKKDSYRYH
jgi:hypothetical protein